MTTFKEAKIGRGTGRPVLQFEFRAFKGADDLIADRPDITFESCQTESAAKAKAGRIAKRIDGPVDLAYAGAADWPERYVTTAMPSQFHAQGYRFERLDG